MKKITSYKKGQETAFGPFVIFMIILLIGVVLIRLAFVGEDAWFVKAGLITNETANSIARLYPYSSGGEYVVSTDLTPPENVKSVFDALKKAIRDGKNTKDIDCILSYQQEKLEPDYSIGLMQTDEGIMFQLIKGRRVLVDKAIIPDVKLCSVVPKLYLTNDKLPYAEWNRIDVEYGSGLSLRDINYVFFSGIVDKHIYYFDSPYGYNLLHKADDNHICLMLFSNAYVSKQSYDAVSFGDESSEVFFNDKTYFTRYGLDEQAYYRPRCMINLPETKFENEFSLSDSKKVTLVTSLYTRRFLTKDEVKLASIKIKDNLESYLKTHPIDDIHKNFEKKSYELNNFLTNTFKTVPLSDEPNYVDIEFVRAINVFKN